jgi:hypothetical protein
VVNIAVGNAYLRLVGKVTLWRGKVNLKVGVCLNLVSCSRQVVMKVLLGLVKTKFIQRDTAGAAVLGEGLEVCSNDPR